MSKLHVRTGDTVMVISGTEKGSKGKILSVNTDKESVIIENVNIVSKHRKPRGQKDMGGITKIEGPVRACKVMVVCPKCSNATRVSRIVTDDGTKSRVCKKCGETL